MLRNATMLSMEPTSQPLRPRSSWGVPVAIMVAGLLICGGIVANGYFNRDTTVAQGNNVADNFVIAPITDTDHIRGNPNAEVFLIEYSDMECPYCKRYHSTLKQLMNDFGTDGKLAWVYRHFPLYQGSSSNPPLHPNAGQFAEGAECVASLGGSEAFWKFIDRFYEQIPNANVWTMENGAAIAEAVGIDKDKYLSCINNGTFTSDIEEAYKAALEAGGRGTPYTVLVKKSGGEPLILDGGAIPYPQLKQIIEQFSAQ